MSVVCMRREYYAPPNEIGSKSGKYFNLPPEWVERAFQCDGRNNIRGALYIRHGIFYPRQL